MNLLDLKNLQNLYKIEIFLNQIENIEKLIETIDFSLEGVPFLNDQGKNSYFTHFHRKVKKIEGESYIFDCFSNETDQLLIKAKSIKSQKEYSVKLQGKSFETVNDIDKKLLSKLRIRENNLLLSQSMESIPKLEFSEEKWFFDIKYKIFVYSNANLYFIKAETDNGKCISIDVPKQEICETNLQD